MQVWATLAVAVSSVLAYIATRFYASRRELRTLQKAGLVSGDPHHNKSPKRSSQYMHP